MFTSLHAIHLNTKEQKQISFPKQNQFDRNPQVVGPYLTWVRKQANEDKADVWMKDGLDGQEHTWIKNVDNAPVFFVKK